MRRDQLQVAGLLFAILAATAVLVHWRVRSGTVDALWATHATETLDSSTCFCEKAKALGRWCAACQVGYVAGLRIQSRLLFDTLDNHGHDVDGSAISCSSCKRALAADGFCQACGMGFIHNQGYFSPLTYWLAKGKAIEISTTTCRTCREDAATGGWCEACQRGMLGGVAISDRAGFEQALPAFRRLKLATSYTGPCRFCAVALYSNGMCPFCRLTYQDGTATPLPSSPRP